MQFNPNNRIALENFYSHSGRDEGRYFEGPNTENNFYYINNRLQFIEEGLLSTSLVGDHFMRNFASSRSDWRVNFARANRDEPDLRETLYQQPFLAGTTSPNPAIAPVLADESQSGFRLFNTLDDETIDGALNWSTFTSTGSRPTQYKLGVGYTDRTRDFESRRFRFIPVVLSKSDPPVVQFNATLQPEELYTPDNIGTRVPVQRGDAPGRRLQRRTVDGRGLRHDRHGVVGDRPERCGARVERFDQTVNTFDPFGLFVRTNVTTNKNTDVFPAVNCRSQSFKNTRTCA